MMKLKRLLYHYKVKKTNLNMKKHIYYNYIAKVYLSLRLKKFNCRGFLLLVCFSFNLKAMLFNITNLV